MYRIFFDTKSCDERGRYSLGIAGAMKDIEPIADHLFEGLRVIIYIGDELEMQAVLTFDASSRVWMADPISETIKYLS